jgi:hypothetical protein
MGFDDETGGVTQSMIECINATSIPLSVVGLLIALPNTQLSRRLEKEGRLFRHYEVVKVDDDYQCSMSLNFTPLRPRRDILADYSRVLQTIYSPVAYFERVRRVGRVLDRSGLRGQMAFKWSELVKLARVVWHMGVRSADVRREFWVTLLDCAWHNPLALEQVMYLMAFYLHHGRFSRVIIEEMARYIEAIDAGRWQDPPVMRAPAPDRPHAGAAIESISAAPL